MANKKKLVLIDGHALAYRAYHALRPDSFSTRQGELTNAVYGFTSMLLAVLRDERPDYIAVSFDVGRTFRHEEYPPYKAHRGAMPEELATQLRRIDEIVEAFNIPVFTAEGYEADDVLGTLARQAAQQGVETLIVTGDTDAFQLIDGHTQVLTSRRQYSDTVIYDEAGIRERYGLKPRQLIDYKGLVGDSSDNIPGVRGVGEKTATQLLQEYGSLEAIYEHLDEVKSPRFRKALEEGRDEAFLSKHLATIVTDVPLKLDLEACRVAEYDHSRVTTLFRELEFRSLLERLPQPPRPPEGPQQLALFEEVEMAAPAAMPAVPTIQQAAGYRTVDSPEALEKLVEELTHSPAFALDTETTSTDAMAADLVGIAVAMKEGQAHYIPVRHSRGAGSQLPPGHVLDKLRPVLEDARITKYAHNAKYDLTVLARYGIAVKGLAFDTMVAEWLIDPASRNLGLKNLAWARLGVEMTPISFLIGKGKSQITIDRVPIEQVTQYAGADVDMTYRLVGLLESELREKELWPLFTEIEMPLVPILVEMEMDGVALDVPFLRNMSDQLQGRLAELEKEIQDQVGYPFNVNSTQQLSDALFIKLGLPTTGLKKTASGHYSTAADVLEGFKDQHPVIGLILEQRELAKLKSTYVDALPQLVNPRTGRVHTSYNQTGTVTGRISCLPAGTLVNTQQGLVGIEMVRTGDLIRTPYGPRRVLAWQATGEKTVVVLKLSNGITLRCSSDHRLRSKGKWMKAGDITIGTPVYMSFTEGLFGTQVALNLDYTTEYRTRKTPTLPKAWTVDLAELVGYVLADGHICRSNYNNKPDKVVLAFGWDEEHLIRHFTQIIERTFGKPATHRTTKSCPVLEVSGVDVAGAFEQLGAGGSSREIRVPPSLLNAPQSIVAAFLRGYFEGDGHVGGDQISVRSTSLVMLEDVQQLLTLFGIPSSISRGSPDPRGYARRYTLRIVGDRSKRIFHDHIGFISPEKQEACAKLAAACSKTSTAELLTLPDGFDIEALKPYLYAAHRDTKGRVPHATILFAHRLARQQAMTLPRAEWMVDSLPDGGGIPEADFVREAVEGQYYEVKVTEISHEAPVPMYDIAVEEVEQYMAQGIVVHNSSDPNLQNIPIRTELGRQVRRAFVAGEGSLLLAADYSQVELRVMAHISQDPALLEAFRRGEDIHTSTAATIMGVPPEAVTPEMRRLAKSVNFGLSYGQGSYGLAQQTGLSQEEADRFIKTYFARYPKVKEYIERTKRQAKEQGYVETLLGRRRYFPELKSEDKTHANIVAAAYRMAINAPIQGSAADILKIAMHRLHRALHEHNLKSRMILQVHDELVLEVPEDEVDTVAPLVREIMEGAFQLDVPLKVDVKVGKNWLEMEAK